MKEKNVHIHSITEELIYVSKSGKSHPIACMDFLLFPIEQSKHVITLLSDTDRIKAKLNKLQN